MNDQQQHHPIAPPQWQMDEWQARIETMGADVPSIILEVAQWGYDQCGEVNEARLQQARDQELEACCEWLGTQWLGARTEGFPAELRDARRPKPPNLKEQALKALAEADLGSTEAEWFQRFGTIRRALEELPDD